MRTLQPAAVAVAGLAALTACGDVRGTAPHIAGERISKAGFDGHADETGGSRHAMPESLGGPFGMEVPQR